MLMLEAAEGNSWAQLLPIPTTLNIDSMSKDTMIINNKNYPCGKYWL